VGSKSSLSALKVAHGDGLGRLQRGRTPAGRAWLGGFWCSGTLQLCMPEHAWCPRLDSAQEVSTKLRKSTAPGTSCSAVSLSMINMDPPQTGQDHEGGGWGEAGHGEDGVGLAGSSCRQRGKRVARRRLARKPKKRMRTKPLGSTWSRKRRKNSSAVRVIFRFLLPWA
jgi:hypothetical protein